MSYHYEIIICSSCNGSGVQERSELVNHHKGDYDYWTETCSFCKGSGSLKKTTTITYEPNVVSKPKPRR
jgi:DnaJ-class molecular chaperone